MSTITFSHFHPRSLTLLKSSNVLRVLSFPQIRIKQVGCTKLTPWESSPVTYAPTETTGDNFLKKITNLFETLKSNNTAEVPVTNTEDVTDSSNQPAVQLRFHKWPMWLLGPSLLLATGMVPTLWIPLSSIFLGPNIASLLSLVGLDCIFNLGAILFLLMADSCARPKQPSQACKSKAPFSYQFWNMVATILTEMLTWHWQSLVWLVTPVVYVACRVLQLMRGLKLGAELSAPAWIMHTIRGLVSWWVLILGIQLMRVAWFAGFTTWASQQQSATADG
ncbi:Cytochrome P450 [Fagus crenata]